MIQLFQDFLPDQNIIITTRSDGSGTTAVFTEALSKFSDLFNSTVGTTELVNWGTTIIAGLPSPLGLIYPASRYKVNGPAYLSDFMKAWQALNSITQSVLRY